MTTSKTEYGAVDLAPVVLYAKTDRDSITAYPVVATTFGTLAITSGIYVPVHDQQIINEADPNNVVITYKLNGVTVGTKTIVVSGTTTTITVS